MASRPALDTVVKHGLKPRALIAVDLFGQPADYDAIEAFCSGTRPVLDLPMRRKVSARDTRAAVSAPSAILTTTSFFPAKPLGCYGDGGAIFTDDDDHLDVLRSLQVHGQGLATNTTMYASA